MKYFCEACERLVPPASFRMEDGLLVVKCSRCKVEMRSVPEQVEEPGAAAASKPAKSKASKAEESSEPVIALGESEAEPDPIENEPTRRVSVPAELLAAIENEARESRRKSKESGPEKTPVPVAAEPAKTPAPAPVGVKPQVPEPVVTKFQAPEPVAAKAPAPEPAPSRPRLAMSETAAANLMVLRLSEVQQRGGGETTVVPPVPEPVPAKASGVQLRLVQDASAPAAPSSSFSSSSEDPFMPPAGYCPKCIGVKKDGAVVCPYCGLDYARFRPEESRPSGAVASTWLGVVELWESKGAHDKVLALASERGELAALGRLYRIRLARHPEDTMAQRGREEVLRLAAASSTFMATPPPDKGTKMKMAGLGLLFLLLMIAAVAIGAQVKRMLTTGTP
ncbi:MAG TPA: hypothetical protein VFZ09_19025 [Archangium sp.]|uniref:hypothetical protein n=1 Tax=Archangium sp. TaxID=1872627 RepID=UPI002E3425DD|nr:hypothetical protein [Archangium sp.]HEX5748341.1 hypothetical protein [Archangium sp.]